MVCVVQLYEKPTLDSPILVEGLPGIGFVANIAVLHLIQELKAKLFGEVRSSAFQDLAITADKGRIRSPTNELYYHRGRGLERDLVLLYGNTQALTTLGQYELCGRILDIANELGCSQILTLGGLKREGKVDVPEIYCAASDPQSLNEALSFGAKTIKGHIFGVAGLLIGLARLKGMRGLCLLAETLGHPDASAAREVLKVACRMLNLQIELAGLDAAVEATQNVLESFGLTAPSTGEKMREEPRSRWLI